MNYKIVLFPKIQVDTAICYFLLKHFGDHKFPGIAESPTLFWTELPESESVHVLEDKGYIIIDLAGSKFDHHIFGEDNKKVCAALMVARYLNIDDRQDLQKLLELARRDDLEGKGTISQDSIDRAFGISGLITALNKSATYTSQQILDIVMPLFYAHYFQEYQRYEELPRQYKSGIEKGIVKEFTAIQYGKQLRVIYIESDNPAMASFLRSREIGADMVIQKASTGHVNFITKQAVRLQLHKLARQIKLLESEKNKLILQIDRLEELELPGRTDGLPHWYYDTRANTLQNGGINPQDIPPSSLLYKEIELAVKQALNIPRSDDKFNRPNNQGFRRSHGAIIID